MCTLCDCYEVEDARHFILHCDFFHIDRVNTLHDISRVDGCIDNAIRDTDKDILYMILGHPIDNVNEDLMEQVRLIVLNAISHMYWKNSNEKRGVG